MADSILHRYRDMTVEQFLAYLTSLKGRPVVTVMDCTGWDDETGEEIKLAKGTALTFGEFFADLHPPHDDISHCFVWLEGRKLTGVALDEIGES